MAWGLGAVHRQRHAWVRLTYALPVQELGIRASTINENKRTLGRSLFGRLNRRRSSITHNRLALVEEFIITFQ